jgi:predicted nucleic acid-binding protein
VITAVDSNILLDVLGGDPTFGPVSANALRAATQEGRLVACEVVWAEVAGSFTTAGAAQEALERLNVEFSALTVEAALEAGTAWRSYREHGGARTRVTADFLIGAHALCQADRLLSRDRGFYRSYFTRLTLLDPSRT